MRDILGADGAPRVPSNEQCDDSGILTLSNSQAPKQAQSNCLRCRKSLPARRKLKSFCNYACRGQYKALEASRAPSGLIGSKNAKRNRALQSLKKQSRAGFSFARINSVTYRLDTPNKRGAGWLMEVAWPGGARQRWIARVGNRASEPLPLSQAKQAAAAMLSERGKPEPRDWIAELNQIAATEVDRAALAQERRAWPADLLGGRRRSVINPEIRASILNAAIGFISDEHLLPVVGDAEPLYDDGLPDCLRRKAVSS